MSAQEYPAGLLVPCEASGFEDALKGAIASGSFRICYQKPGEIEEWRDCEVPDDKALADILVTTKSGKQIQVFDPNVENRDGSKGNHRHFRLDRILAVHLTHGAGDWDDKPVIQESAAAALARIGEPPAYLDAAPLPEDRW